MHSVLGGRRAPARPGCGPLPESPGTPRRRQDQAQQGRSAADETPAEADVYTLAPRPNTAVRAL